MRSNRWCRRLHPQIGVAIGFHWSGVTTAYQLLSTEVGEGEEGG